MSLYDSERRDYDFHAQDRPDTCFICNIRPPELRVLRHTSSMKLVHLCPECLVNNLDDYLLDNTRPWFARDE